MSLLRIERVSKRYRERQREHIALRDVSLQLDEGELVVIWGMRRSGRTTLLRIAAGLETSDSGSVHFEGRDLRTAGNEILGEGIGYVRKNLRVSEEQGVLEQVSTPMLARGIPVAEARNRARHALTRVGADGCAALSVSELGAGETVRVALAATLALSPKLLILDEPAGAVELSERDQILTLLRTLAGEGIAVLASTAEPGELAGAHRAMTLSDGELRGPAAASLAPVVELHARGA